MNNLITFVRKHYLAILLVFAVISIFVVAIALSQKKDSDANASSNTNTQASFKTQLGTAVKNQSTSEYLNDVKPNDVILSSNQIADNYYLVTVPIPSVNGSTSDALIRKDNDGGYTLMDEPNIGFDNAKLVRKGVPQTVIDQLPQAVEENE